MVEVEDDGVGGATLSTGSGLAGLRDRISAFQGALIIDSPAGEGTRIRAEIPLPNVATREPRLADGDGA